MKFYAITAVSNFLERPLIQSFHADMFHGLAERNGKEWPHDPKVWANTESFTPLLISRTVHSIPEVSRPGRHLVVSERLAGRLRPIPNIRLAQVVFKRLVDVAWAKGDSSWWKTWRCTDPCDLLRTQPDVSGLGQRIGSFFEVQTFRLNSILDRYPSAKNVIIETGTPPFHKKEAVKLSFEILTEYPMLRWSSIIVNEQVFDILDPFLDRDFFIVRNYEVS